MVSRNFFPMQAGIAPTTSKHRLTYTKPNRIEEGEDRGQLRRSEAAVT